MAGVHRFKLGFNPDLVTYPGAFDLPLQTARAWLLTSAPCTCATALQRLPAGQTGRESHRVPSPFGMRARVRVSPPAPLNIHRSPGGVCRTRTLRQPSDQLIDSVHFDSRQVGAGACFVARRGLRDDGHAYIPSAIAAGAVAVVAERPVEVPAHVGLGGRAGRPDGRSRRWLGDLWGEPDLALGTVGVTGTDGKTTTSHLIATMLQAQGLARRAP